MSCDITHTENTSWASCKTQTWRMYKTHKSHRKTSRYELSLALSKKLSSHVIHDSSRVVQGVTLENDCRDVNFI